MSFVYKHVVYIKFIREAVHFCYPSILFELKKRITFLNMQKILKFISTTFSNFSRLYWCNKLFETFRYVLRISCIKQMFLCSWNDDMNMLKKHLQNTIIFEEGFFVFGKIVSSSIFSISFENSMFSKHIREKIPPEFKSLNKVPQGI